MCQRTSATLLSKLHNIAPLLSFTKFAATVQAQPAHKTSTESLYTIYAVTFCASGNFIDVLSRLADHVRTVVPTI